MYFKEYYPDSFFSRYIDSYFTIDTSLVYEDITDLVVPDGTFGLLFIDSHNSIKRNSNSKSPPITLKRTSLFGQKTKAINYYYSPGKTQSFGVKINPQGLPLFMDFSSEEVKNLHIELDSLADKSISELEDKVFQSKTVAEKIEKVEAFMLQRIVKLNQNKDYLLFVAIVEHIKHCRGEVRFDAITDHFNVNYKKVERLFLFYLGITPKYYIRIIRFNATIHLQNHFENYNLTQLGNEVGFFDQSHFIREFRSFTSLTPKKFFNKQLSSSEKVMRDMISKRWEK
jgi:AraC-like DNA-binding protein